jgi:hypothetical protein
MSRRRCDLAASSARSQRGESEGRGIEGRGRVCARLNNTAGDELVPAIRAFERPGISIRYNCKENNRIARNKKTFGGIFRIVKGFLWLRGSDGEQQVKAMMICFEMIGATP